MRSFLPSDYRFVCVTLVIFREGNDWNPNERDSFCFIPEDELRNYFAIPVYDITSYLTAHQLPL